MTAWNLAVSRVIFSAIFVIFSVVCIAGLVGCFLALASGEPGMFLPCVGIMVGGLLGAGFACVGDLLIALLQAAWRTEARLDQSRQPCPPHQPAMQPIPPQRAVPPAMR